MKKILFICHGNICRSPMAEYIMKDLARKAGLESQFQIASAATSREEFGSPVYPPTQRKLAEYGIGCSYHAVRQLVNDDYEKYNLLIGMDRVNLRDMCRVCGRDFTDEMYLLLDYADRPGQEVADPWYTDNFEAAWRDVSDGCQGLLDHLMIAQREREISTSPGNKIRLFEDKRVRATWDKEKEEWYFSVVGMVAILTGTPNHQAAKDYRKITKKRLAGEGFEPVTPCSQLRMTAADGKKRLTDVAGAEQLLQIIQFIPSHKVEPFRRWLTGVDRGRIEETIDPELIIDRVLETYLKKGHPREWANRRLQIIRVGKELTDKQDARGVQKGVEYAILTDEVSRAWSGMTTRQYKAPKGLTKENLHDNMTTLELVLSMLAKTTTTEIPKQKEPVTFSENIETACTSGKVVDDARKAIEAQTGVPAITSEDATQLSQIVVDTVEGSVIPSGEDADS